MKREFKGGFLYVVGTLVLGFPLVVWLRSLVGLSSPLVVVNPKIVAETFFIN